MVADGNRLSEHVPSLEQLLEPYPDARIVPSTSGARQIQYLNTLKYCGRGWAARPALRLAASAWTPPPHQRMDTVPDQRSHSRRRRRVNRRGYRRDGAHQMSYGNSMLRTPCHQTPSRPAAGVTAAAAAAQRGHRPHPHFEGLATVDTEYR